MSVFSNLQEFPDDIDYDAIDHAQVLKSKRCYLHSALLIAAFIATGYLLYSNRNTIVGAVRSLIPSKLPSLYDMEPNALGQVMETSGLIDM